LIAGFQAATFLYGEQTKLPVEESINKKRKGYAFCVSTGRALKMPDLNSPGMEISRL
jgi:hypothetical protein